jgi:hypothetical protein
MILGLFEVELEILRMPHLFCSIVVLMQCDNNGELETLCVSNLKTGDEIGVRLIEER